MRSTLYQTVRQMFMLRTSGSAAVELIQAGLLIAYYACGHGLPRDAHMTLAICVTLARLIGVDFEETGNSTGLDDRRSVCRWVIVLLDRTVAMSSVNDPMPLVLPLNLASNDKRLTSILDVKAPHRRFEVSSRVALLIGTALGHANDPRPIRLTGSTYRDIDNRMEILVRELVWASKDELDTYTYCESTALAVIAHLALQVVNPSSGKVGANSKEAMLLQSTLRMVRDQFRAATDMLPEGESYSMSVVALCNLTRAAAISLRICGNNFLHKELDELRAVLQRFSARWTLGGIYLEYIDEILRSSMPEADPSPVVQRDL
ncbi:MAG: hypothetical protein M1820_001409 [Bogoriella megaspora]|nr:MAG: hypothetical protein M1820_001409 [Bogoriella megaspora]